MRKLKPAYLAMLVIGLVILQQASFAVINPENQVQALRILAQFDNAGQINIQQEMFSAGEAVNSFSLDELRNIAQKNGMQVISQKISLNKLRQIGASAIVYLTNPEALVVIAGFGEKRGYCLPGKRCRNNFS